MKCPTPMSTPIAQPLHLRLSEHCGMGVMVERLKPLEGQEVCLETVSFRYAHQISAL